MAFDFTGKTVMIFGGTSGINLGIAKAFAKAGAKLGVASRSPPPTAHCVPSATGASSKSALPRPTPPPSTNSVP